MTTRLTQVVFDAFAPRDLATFWAESLGWRIVIDEPDEVEIAGTEDDANLVFVPTSEPRTHKSRLHLDLRTDSDAELAALIERVTGAGAARIDIGQGNVPHGVFADPEGNEFCITPPGYYDAPTGPVGALCLTSIDHRVQSAFWSAATGWPRVRRGLHRGTGPFLVFGGGEPAAKHGKNRTHIDVAPYRQDDQEAEVARLESHGARRVDIGQHDVPWVVLADPEDNEFCVLTPR